MAKQAGIKCPICLGGAVTKAANELGGFLDCQYCGGTGRILPLDMPQDARQRPTDLGSDISEAQVHSAVQPPPKALKQSVKDSLNWRVLLPRLIGDELQWDLQFLAEDQMNFLKIPEWRRYDAIAYAYSAGKAFYGDRMTFGIFMERLRNCKIPEQNKKVEIDYLAEINAMVEGGE